MKWNKFQTVQFEAKGSGRSLLYFGDDDTVGNRYILILNGGGNKNKIQLQHGGQKVNQEATDEQKPILSTFKSYVMR